MGNQAYLNKYDARNVSRKRNLPTGRRKVAIDVRVSTEHEKQINALDNQKQWAMELAADHEDWDFNPDNDLYIEEGLSGTSMKKRPDFARMIRLAKEGKYDLIVVREVCRFMRNAKLTLILVDELLDYGVEVYFVNDVIWSRNEDDYFKLTIMAQYAEQESRKISERVFQGQAIARENGVIFGNGNILGYKHIKGEKSCDTTYVIDEEQAKTVRTIYELSLKGYGMKKIRSYLMKNNFLTAEGNTVWYESTIERILRRSTYMGEMTYLQSVTEDPLTHSRTNVDKEMHIHKKVRIPRIIEPEMWCEVQDAIDSRINHDWKKDDKHSGINGKVENKDIICRKMRCGCGRRFKKDYETSNDTATYRCYELVDDGNQENRRERSAILEDNCCIYGIRDWKMDLFTLKVFEYLECNTEIVRERLLSIIEIAFTDEVGAGYSVEDKLKIEAAIKKLQEKNARLLDGYEEGIISADEYKSRKAKNDVEIEKSLLLKSKLTDIESMQEHRTKTLEAVKEFLNKALEFPSVSGMKVQVPEALFETYVNSIKACANNLFEYNIRINPNAMVQIPVIPDEEFNPQLHSARNIIDNSSASLIAEFTVDYTEAKEYANSRKRKVNRVHFKEPATIRIYANL